MTELTYTLLGDGSSDESLLQHLNWLMRQHVRADLPLRQLWADLSRVRPRPKGLPERIEAACKSYPCDILFVHRDAEASPHGARREEIEAALRSTGAVVPPVVCVVPVRMQEAWLLLEEAAIRSAAGNPNGRVPMQMPKLRGVEGIPDPKDCLYQLLRTASGFRGRRLQKFRVRQSARRVAELIDDFSPLRCLPAFATLESDLVAVLRRNQWIDQRM